MTVQAGCRPRPSVIGRSLIGMSVKPLTVDMRRLDAGSRFERFRDEVRFGGLMSGCTGSLTSVRALPSEQAGAAFDAAEVSLGV